MIDELYNKAINGELLTDSEVTEYTNHIKFLLNKTDISIYMTKEDFSDCVPIVLHAALEKNSQNLINCHKYLWKEFLDWCGPLIHKQTKGVIESC
jgi:hypothetical protein